MAKVSSLLAPQVHLDDNLPRVLSTQPWLGCITCVDCLLLCVTTGTGKSLLLRAIISALRKKHAKKPEVISVTASTGMAASNIGGTEGFFMFYYMRLATWIQE